MEPSEVGNLGAFSLVLLLLGKEALALLARNGNEKTNGASRVITTLKDSDERLEHIQGELAEFRNNLAQLIVMYHGMELRLKVQDHDTLKAATEIQLLWAEIRRTI